MDRGHQGQEIAFWAPIQTARLKQPVAQIAQRRQIVGLEPAHCGGEVLGEDDRIMK